MKIGKDSLTIVHVSKNKYREGHPTTPCDCSAWPGRGVSGFAVAVEAEVVVGYVNANRRTKSEEREENEGVDRRRENWC